MEAFSDATANQIELFIRQRIGSQVRGLRVVREGLGLVLDGWALTYYAKQLAQEIARQAAQLPIVANRIAVRTSAASDLEQQDQPLSLAHDVS